MPAAFTVASDVFDDCHVAWLVTFCVVPFDMVAVAVNCEVNPTFGAVPATAIEETVAVGVVGVSVLLLLLHAAAVAISDATPRVRARDFKLITMKSVYGPASAGPMELARLVREAQPHAYR